MSLVHSHVLLQENCSRIEEKKEVFFFHFVSGFFSFTQRKRSLNQNLRAQNALERIPQSPVPTTHLHLPAGDKRCIQPWMVGSSLETCEDSGRIFLNCSVINSQLHLEHFAQGSQFVHFPVFFFSLTLNKYSFIILVLCSQSAYISHRHWPKGKYGELSLLCWHQALLFTNSSLCHTL